MPKTRRLSDLYVMGKPLSVDDGAGDPVNVWIQKLNPVDHETALRHANGMRARTLSMRADPDGDEYQTMRTELNELSEAEVVEFVVAEDEATLRAPIEAELAAEEEWSKDNYLQGLYDSWSDGLSRRFAENSEDPEALRVFEELKRFNTAVDDALESAVANVRRDVEAVSLEVNRERAFDRMLKMRAELAWLQEYRRCEVWLSVREPDRKRRYFSGRHDVDELAVEVLQQLSNAYRELSLDPMEGKGSPETDSSSPSSEQSGEEETAQPSGQGGVAA